MTSWHCPKCGHTVTTVGYALSVSHYCKPGIRRTWTALVRTDHPTNTSGNPGEHTHITQREHPTSHHKENT